MILWAMSSTGRYPLGSAYLSFLSNVSWGEQNGINCFHALASYLKLRDSNGPYFHPSPEILKAQDQWVADGRFVNLLAEVVLLKSGIKKSHPRIHFKELLWDEQIEEGGGVSCMPPSKHRN